MLGHGAGAVQGAAFRHNRGTYRLAVRHPRMTRVRCVGQSRAGTQNNRVPIAVEVVGPEDVLRPLLAPGPTVVRLIILQAEGETTSASSGAIRRCGQPASSAGRTMATTPSRNSW